MHCLIKLLGALGISSDEKKLAKEREKVREVTIRILEKIHYLGRIHKENRLYINCQELDLKTDGSFPSSDYFKGLCPYWRDILLT
jgi:hypothetical protein